MTNDKTVDILEVLDFFGVRYVKWGWTYSDEIEVFCPFCEDKDSRRPAGRVNVLKNVYFCFNCGAGGSPRTLVDNYTTIEVAR